jgi:phage portal protein BeeE
MSWLRPAMEDVVSDNGARRFLTKFWENHATPNNVVTFDPEKDVEEIREFRDLFLEKHQGVDRAFRTAFLGGGADIKVIGSSLKDLDAGNVRQQVHFDIALAAGINPMAIGLMQVNYSNTKEGNRSISDRKLRYLWLKAVDAFRPLIPKPAGFELWYDVSGVAALQADSLDDAQVQAQQAQTMRTLVDGGFVPEAVMDSVTSGDWSKLKHSGLLSVQTQAPGSGNQGGGSGG